jgi:hypothetical protein
MKTQLLKQTESNKNSCGPVAVTRKMLRDRAVELAVSNGRATSAVSKSDWEQAKRELAGNAETETAIKISAAESERWDPLPGSVGHKVHVPSGDEEDDEGRSDAERLVEGGVRDAGREQMREAAGEPTRNERAFAPDRPRPDARVFR